MQPLRFTKLMSASLIKGLLFSFVHLLPACSPQGQLTRHIHPLSQSAGKGLKGSEQLDETESHQSGIPKNCDWQTSSKNTCLLCRTPQHDIERCIEKVEPGSEKLRCFYRQENIKCIQSSPPKAISINLRHSIEKEIWSHFKTWQDTIKSIATPKLDSSDLAKIESGIQLTEQLIKVILSANKPATWQQSFLNQNTSIENQAASLERELNLLQTRKESGRLKLVDILQFCEKLLEHNKTPKNIIEYWSMLSTEGLEDMQFTLP